jgi:predicted ATP-dependent serine protease
MDNGPPRELSGSHESETVYCVDCGNVFVWAEGRDCPACHAWETAHEEVQHG